MPQTRIRSVAIPIVPPQEERDEIDGAVIALAGETWTNSDGCSRRKSLREIEEGRDTETDADDRRDRWGRRLSLDKIFH